MFSPINRVSQTCLGANVPSGLVPSTFFKTYFWAFLGPCVQGGTEYVSFELFLGILSGPGEGRGGAPGTVPLQNPEVTSRKACLRNTDMIRKWGAKRDAKWWPSNRCACLILSDSKSTPGGLIILNPNLPNSSRSNFRGACQEVHRHSQKDS